MLGTAVNANAVVSAVGTIVTNDAVVIVATDVIGVAVATLTASLSVVATSLKLGHLREGQKRANSKLIKSYFSIQKI